jgi:hypothetical protein
MTTPKVASIEVHNSTYFQGSQTVKLLANVGRLCHITKAPTKKPRFSKALIEVVSGNFHSYGIKFSKKNQLETE